MSDRAAGPRFNEKNPDAAFNAYVVELEKSIDTLEVAVSRHLRRVTKLESALREIAAPHDCGCCPCTGACLSQEALQITLDEFRDIAREALRT